MTQPHFSYASVLALHGLEMRVHLGVSEEERAAPQSVLIDIRLYMPEPPAAASGDNAPYLCYYTLSETVRELCASRPYRLIEYLTHAIYRQLRGLVAADIKIALKLHKPVIGLDYAVKGASYAFTDLPAGSWVAPA